MQQIFNKEEFRPGGFEPWYRLVTDPELYKTHRLPEARLCPSKGLLERLDAESDPGIKAQKIKLLFAKTDPPFYATGGDIYERMKCILVNPMKNISIIGKDDSMLYPLQAHERTHEIRGSECEKALIKLFYENPMVEELNLNRLETKHFDHLRTDVVYSVVTEIPKGYHLLSEGNDRHHVPGVQPFPLMLASKSLKGEIILKDRDVFSDCYLEKMINGKVKPDRSAIKFMTRFIEEYLPWLVERGAIDLYHYQRFWGLQSLVDGPRLYSRIYDRLTELGAK